MIKMAQEKKDFEYVSSLMDGELDDQEFDRLLNDEEAKDKWYAYHLIRDCLQNPQQVSDKEIRFTLDEEFSRKLAQTVQERPVSPAKRSHAGQADVVAVAGGRNFYRFAVAASIMAVGVITWQLWPAAQGAGTVNTVQQTTLPAKTDSQVVPVAAKSQAVPENSNVVVPNAAVQNQGEAVVQSTVQVEKAASQPGAASAVQ